MVTFIRAYDNTQPVRVEQIHGNTFNGEDGAHRFMITGVPEGVVTAYMMRADGTTCTVDGTNASGTATVTLNQDCYNVPGRFTLSIFVGDTGERVCVYACVGTVYRTRTETIIDSGDVVPSLDDVIAMYQDVQEATTEARNSATSNIGLKDSVTAIDTLTGTQVEITNALPMPPDAVVMEIEPSQDGTPTPSSPIDVTGISTLTLIITDDEGQNANTVEVDLVTASGGVVYGGTLTLNADGTGTLSLTWAKKTLAQIDADGGGFTRYTSGTNPLFRITMPGRKIGTNVEGFCNAYDFDRSASIGSLSTNVPDKCFGYQSTQLHIVFRDDDYQESDYDSRADMIAAWLAANVNTYVVYELATPVEIQVTFTPVALYDGGNILTNDAGLSMAVTYRKDKYYTAEEAEYALGSLNGWALTVGAPEQVRGKRYVLKSEWVFPPTGSSDPPALYTRWVEES